MRFDINSFHLNVTGVFYIRGESYINFNDEIYYTRKWCEKIVGKQTTDAIFEFSEKFNQLELFDSEKAILFPLIITNYGNNFNFIKYFFFFNY